MRAGRELRLERGVGEAEGRRRMLTGSGIWEGRGLGDAGEEKKTRAGVGRIFGMDAAGLRCEARFRLRKRAVRRGHFHMRWAAPRS